MQDIPRTNNTAEGKWEIRHNTHNRKPGAARYWKEMRNRAGRRWGRRQSRWMIKSWDNGR